LPYEVKLRCHWNCKDYGTFQQQLNFLPKHVLSGAKSTMKLIYTDMDEAKFRRLRQIILASTEFISGGFGFDTYKAQQKGYPEHEIAIADHLLTDYSFYTSEILKDIRLLTNEPDACLKVYFIEFAKIIFVLYEDNQKSTYWFEEDLHQAE